MNSLMVSCRFYCKKFDFVVMFLEQFAFVCKQKNVQKTNKTPQNCHLFLSTDRLKLKKK